jgi:hypothetical protein
MYVIIFTIIIRWNEYLLFYEKRKMIIAIYNLQHTVSYWAVFTEILKPQRNRNWDAMYYLFGYDEVFEAIFNILFFTCYSFDCN